MKQIKVLGSGCSKCIKTAELIETVARDADIAVQLVKETSPEVMMFYGVMRTPAVVVDEQLMHSGSIPNRQQIETWLQ